MSMTNPATKQRRLWIRTPLSLLAEGGAGGLVIEGSRIIEMIPSGGKPSQPVDEVFDASRHVILPGLINTHHHFFQTLTRAHPQAIDKELFPWLQALYPVWSRLTADHLRLAIRVALAELLLSGCTTAADHHYLFPRGTEHAVDIEVEEARSLGIRMTVSRGSMNVSVKDGGLPPEAVVQDHDVIMADTERVLNRYHDTSDGAMIQIAVAPCSPFSNTPLMMRECAELAARFDAPLHTHLAETLDEDKYCLEVFKKRPLDLLDDAGWMRPRTWLAHGIHFTCEECDRLGKAGVGVCHCPTSNGILASGFCKTRELEAAGAPVGLGVDGSASNDGSNLMEEVRHALMINRLHYASASLVTARDTLRWATEGSARCLGRSDIGTIAVGKQADLALFTLDELRFSGAHDPIAALVLCGANRADRVMVAGQWRVVDGHIPGLDVAALVRDHSAASRRYA
jgi:8-oxoguanine deaminase